jgi:hypothetical protein
MTMAAKSLGSRKVLPCMKFSLKERFRLASANSSSLGFRLNIFLQRRSITQDLSSVKGGQKAGFVI